MSNDALDLLDTEAKLAELEALLPGALVEHLIEILTDALRRKSINLIGEGVRSQLAGC